MIFDLPIMNQFLSRTWQWWKVIFLVVGGGGVSQNQSSDGDRKIGTHNSVNSDGS